MKKEAIGKRIKTLRIIQGQTLTSYAKKLGLTPAGLSQIENDKRQPSYKTICRIIKILKVDPRYLFNY